MKKILLALLIIVIFLFGCIQQPAQEQPEELLPQEEEAEQPSEVPIPQPILKTGKGTLNLFISDEKNLISDFDSLKIIFNIVKIYKPSGSETIEKNIEATVDLTELQESKAMKILETELEEGTYSKIKLYANSIKGTLLGNDVEAIFPDGGLLLEKSFKIKEGEETIFVIDLEAAKTGKTTTTTGLEQYELKTVPLKSGTVPTDVTYIKEITAAEMMLKINEKAGKKFDRRIFMTQGKGFAPHTITVEAGTKVIWENKDTKSLGIIMEGGFDKFIRAGGSYEHIFKRAGTYPYNMKYFISNKGEITVVLPQEAPKEETKQAITKNVEITNTGFMPAELNIKKGTKVIFTNKDTKSHNLVIGGDPVTYKLAPNEAHANFYNNLGTFSFYDGYNVKDYSGKVTVT